MVVMEGRSWEGFSNVADGECGVAGVLSTKRGVEFSGCVYARGTLSTLSSVEFDGEFDGVVCFWLASTVNAVASAQK